MANIHIRHQHQLTQGEARALMEQIAQDLKNKLKAEYHLKGDSLRFRRAGASGSVDLGEGFVEVKIKLGLVLAPMRGKIEKSIRQNIDVVLTNGKGTKFT